MALDLEKAKHTLYGVAQGENYAHMRTSIFDGLKARARQRNDVLEIKRLEQEEQETVDLCRDLHLPVDKALALASRIRDLNDGQKRASAAGQTFTPKTQVSEHDHAALIQRWGEKYGDITQNAATRVAESLKSKPALAATLRDSGAVFDADCISIVGNAVVSSEIATASPVKK